MDSATRELFRPGGANSQADFPLTAGNEWMGYIGVTGKPAGYFDEEKQHLYQTLAEQGAVALRAARLRETIRESQQRLSLLVQQSPLAVIEWNTEFHVVSWNPAAEQIFGYTGEEALGRHPAGFIVPEETVSQVEPTWHNLLTHTGSAHVTHDHLTKDGRRITCEWFSAPLVGVDGQIIGVASLVQDITERRQAEEALKDKTAELDRYFTNALDLFCIADTDGYFRRLNKEWESTLGYSIQELEGTRFLDYIHPDDMEATLTAISRLGEQKEVLNFVNRYRSKDGSYRWIEWRSSAVGKTIYAAARDITERKRAEEALRESEEKYRRLVELSPVAMWINKGGIITYMNPAALRILGATDLQQVVGRAVLDFIHPDYHVIVKERSSQTMDHAQIVPLLEEKYVRLDGSVVEVEVTATPFMTAGGRAVQVLFQDITERKRAEEALRKSEERFRALVETTSDWIWEVDGNGVYTYSSPKVKDTLGYEPHEVVGRTPFDFMLPNEAARIAASFKQIMDQKLPIANLENTCLHKNGRAVVLETSGVPILNRMGQLIGYRGIDRDITDRKQAEEALRQANLVVESSPAMLFRWKAAKGRPVILVSQNVTQLGYTAEEFLNGLTNFASIMHPDDLERVDREVQSYSANGIDRFQQEYRIITKDGQVRWIDDRTVAERNADGQVTRYQGIVVDITHRKLVEEALRQSRNLLQAVLDTIPARVFWKDCDLRYLGCNRSFALDAGVNSLDDVIGKDDYQLAWREQASLYRSDDRQVLESGKPKIDYEEPQTTLDGRCIWLRTSKVPLRDTKGAVWGVLGTYEDITTRKQVEEALKESEEKFRSIVENALAGIFMIDDAYQFVYTNDELCRILRYSREELLGLDFREVLVDDSRALVADWYVRRWRGGRFPPRYELDVVRRDGEVRHIEMSVVVVNDAAGRPRSIGQLVDITERKQAERERESLIAELERKNAELERFTYTVSHDLKSPLITIKGFLGYLEKAALSGNIDQLRSDIARIGEAAKKMERLLSELLELSRIGRIINPPEAVPFEAIAREAVELVRGQLAARQVTMTIAESLPIVYGDRARLVEVMQNLVDNAVKFMSDQAQPRIEIGVRVAAPGSPPVFYVRDNGLGVEPQYHQRIFVLFDKLDVRSEGTGVGLTLVKRIIEVHGGRIWVESEGLGKGCTFCFTLADEPAATSPASESHPAISSLGK
jgi:PAS domain S-box-containing protein